MRAREVTRADAEDHLKLPEASHILLEASKTMLEESQTAITTDSFVGFVMEKSTTELRHRFDTSETDHVEISWMHDQISSQGFDDAKVNTNALRRDMGTNQ